MNNTDRNESFRYLDICVHVIAKKYGKENIEAWTNKDYLLLSSILFRQTGVQISPSTLKRIFGKMKTAERYYPQQATRDTLVQYAGFTDWDSFKRSQRDQAIIKDPAAFEEGAVNMTEQPVTSRYKAMARNKKAALCLLIILVITTLTILVITHNGKKKNIDGHLARLICSKPAGTTPHSATFKLKLPGGFAGNPDKFTIDFGDGHSEQSIIAGRLFTHYYEVPGRFYAVLKYDTKPCDTVPIYLTTNGWTATANIQHDTSRVFPVKIKRLSDSGRLEVSADDVYDAGVDTMRTFFVNFVNSTPLNISGDNFELYLNLTTSHSRPGVRCSQANLTLYGERSQDMVIFIKPGCVSWSELNFSEIKYSGDKADLSYLGADFESGGSIVLRVNNKQVALMINNTTVFKTAYTFPLKKIFGVSIMFAGIGRINAFLLKDLNTGELFSGGINAGRKNTELAKSFL